MNKKQKRALKKIIIAIVLIILIKLSSLVVDYEMLFSWLKSEYNAHKDIINSGCKFGIMPSKLSRKNISNLDYTPRQTMNQARAEQRHFQARIVSKQNTIS